LFAELTAGFATDDVNGSAARDLIEPGGEDGIGCKPMGIAGKVVENTLGDFSAR
jgi:hypothetical protein